MKVAITRQYLVVVLVTGARRTNRNESSNYKTIPGSGVGDWGEENK
jgi:hypothetical protein